MDFLPWQWNRSSSFVSLILLTISTSSEVPASSFDVQPVALTATSGPRGPEVGPGTAFAGFNGDPSIGVTGEVAYPGDLIFGSTSVGEGFWLNKDSQNVAIALTDNDGRLGPGLGQGVVIENTFHEVLTGSPGSLLMGGFLAGSGVGSSNNLVYVRHDATGNVPIARTGVDSVLGPNLGGGVSFSEFSSAQFSPTNVVLLRAQIAGLGVTPASDEGYWRNTGSVNQLIARSGDSGPPGPGLGEQVTFDGGSTTPFGLYQIIEGSGDGIFEAGTLNSATTARNSGLWRNTPAGNAPLALSGTAGDLGPGLGPTQTFAGPPQPSLGSFEFDANAQGTAAYFSALSDGRQGLWRNVGRKNEPLMLTGDTGALGPGVGFQDSFAVVGPARLLPSPAINEDNDVVFPGLLASAGKSGLWLHSGNENRVIALAGADGPLGPDLAPGVRFTGFNRAYFGDNETVYFTADLSFNVPFNRNLGLWAYREGRIQPIAVYNELVDVDPTAGVDQRRVEWVQIPSDFTFNNDYGANDSNLLAFRMGFQDGSQGIFLATPIPEPNSLYRCLALGIAVAQHRRIRR